jgi:hypothetical protein
MAALIIAAFLAGLLLGRRTAVGRASAAVGAPRLALVRPEAPARRPRRRPGYAGTLTLRIQGEAEGRRAVEALIRRQTRRVEIDDLAVLPDGSATVRYQVQFDSAASREHLAHHLISEARPHVLAAAVS